MAGSKVKTADLLDAIKGSGGIVSTIAKRLGVAWNTARTAIDANEAATLAYNDEQQIILDMAESTLFAAIKDKDVQAAKWLLATKAKTRGYNEKQEIEISGGVEVRTIERRIIKAND